MMNAAKTAATGVLLAAVGLSAGACGDLLTVEDPQRYTDEDLDQALEAVANGVEGDLALSIDNYVIYTALLSDVYAHTGTWAGYDDVDHGRIIYGNSAADGTMDGLLRTRWFAQNTAARLDSALASEADASPMMAQVKSVEAWTQLLLAQSFCEAPSVPEGPAVADEDLYDLAVDEFNEALGIAEAAGADGWVNFNNAGLARANLMLGNLSDALTHAQAVPDGYVKYAFFSANSGRQENSVTNLTTVGYNKAAGMRSRWWPMVDTIAGYLVDPYTGEMDPRVPIVHPAGELGVDGNTPHYSQYKYPELGSDIPLTHSGEMRLIEAEVYWRQDELAMALQVINEVRADAGLGPVPDTSDPDVVRDYLLHERFAELFMEGHRLNDLYRFGLVADLLGTGRPTKFPLSEAEAIVNPNIEDNASARCLPLS